jgi:hypothetical protein
MVLAVGRPDWLCFGTVDGRLPGACPRNWLCFALSSLATPVTHTLSPDCPAPPGLALFDAHDKSRRVGFWPAFPGQYQGSVRSIPTSVGRVLFVAAGWLPLPAAGCRTRLGGGIGFVCTAAGAGTARPSQPCLRPATGFVRHGGPVRFRRVANAHHPPGRANWLCFASLPNRA